MTEPETPLGIYQAIIDELVKVAKESVSGSLVLEEGIFSRAPDGEQLNAFVKTLSPEQRVLLSRMLGYERTGAIHDALASLTWWIVARDVGFTFQGQQMPVDISGMGLHGDYIGRLNDWEWPVEDA